MGLMDTLGAFVLRRALSGGQALARSLCRGQSVALAGARRLVDLVRAALAESGVPPERLMLEITEGVLIDNPDEMVKRNRGPARARRAHRVGRFRLRLFQFWAISSVSARQAQDRQELCGRARHRANGGVIIQAIVALGRALGLTVVVEGVETEQQRVLLRLARLRRDAGLFVRKAGPAKAIDRLLARDKTGPQRHAASCREAADSLSERKL